MKPAPPGIARFDPATAMVQALATCLHESRSGNLAAAPHGARATALLRALPAPLTGRSPRAGGWLGTRDAIGTWRAARLDVERIASWLCGLYPARPYQAAFIGASNGAIVQLAAALDAPWLPQTFLCPVRAPFADPDDATRGLSDGRGALDALVAADARIAVHQVQDPAHDRDTLHAQRLYQIKQRALPLAWREFLLASLPPGATLYVDVCTLQWPVTHLGPRSVFQFGAPGGATRVEYFRGGPRVRRLFDTQGVTLHHWDPPRPNGHAPEAEWGFDPALLDELHTLCADAGWRLVELRFDEPQNVAFVATAIYRDWYRTAGITPSRLLVDSGGLLDPGTTLRLRALPFWLVRNTDSAAQALAQLLEHDGPFDAIDTTLGANSAHSIGVPPLTQWRALLDGACSQTHVFSTQGGHTAREAAGAARFHRLLERRGPVSERSMPLSVTTFEQLLDQHAATHGLTLARRERHGVAA